MIKNNYFGSKQITSAAIKMSLTEERSEEKELQERFNEIGIYTCAVDFGGEFVSSVSKIIERAIVAAKREGLIDENHAEEGAVAGATRKLYLK